MQEIKTEKLNSKHNMSLFYICNEQSINTEAALMLLTTTPWIMAGIYSQKRMIQHFKRGITPVVNTRESSKGPYLLLVGMLQRRQNIFSFFDLTTS